ncbi:hypothetical protein J8I87_42295 [Paraburkholderia sp. LEh10]|uniref:hypothetical protein n=1 Tax=Paraburkholderia sp. LEh10 TaxID=2821353 RepID=UPI001AE28820|nr:hypothetical protein [Paraburkholderia sp. LEh10]MBP0596124.1 hypothetical protein [Paraburkholderia sp. LEh10]
MKYRQSSCKREMAGNRVAVPKAVEKGAFQYLLRNGFVPMGTSSRAMDATMHF